MKITQVSIKAHAVCRGCGKTQPLDGWGETHEAAEVMLHEEMENKGWTDNLCQSCSQGQFLTVPSVKLTETQLIEAGKLLDAVKHCWPRMREVLAFNDLLMRRTPPKDWTLKNLRLARRANIEINEL